MPGTPLVQVELLVEWAAAPIGSLEIAANDADLAVGTIAANEADLAAGFLIDPDFTATFGGPYDDLSRLMLIGTAARGRSDRFAANQAATAQFTVRDSAGLFNYKNAASPLFGQIETRMHPVRWRIARAGVWQTKFWGYTQRITFQRKGRKAVTVFDCVDLYYRLANAKPVIAPMGQTTTGAAIGAILDSIGWPNTAGARLLDGGDTIPGFSADGSKSGLDLIGDLLTAERGDFFINGEGVPVYEARYARFLAASTATIVDRMTDVQPQVDFDLVKNRARVSRTDFAGNVLYTAQADDVVSQGAIGLSDADAIESPYLFSNAQADGLAAWLVALLAEPTPPARSLVIDGRENDLVDLILDLELASRLTIQEDVGGTDGDFFVEQLAVVVVAPGRLSGSYALSSASTETSVLFVAANDADLAVGTIAANDADTAAGVLVY